MRPAERDTRDGTSNRVLTRVDFDANVTFNEYDVDGRRTRMTLSLNGQTLVDQAYTYAIVDAFTYDNLWTYTWTRLRAALAAATPWHDNENRLVVPEKSGAGVPPANRLRLEFVYDFHGRRRMKKVYTWDPRTQNWELRTQHSFIWLDPPSPSYGATGWLLLETRDVTPSAGSGPSGRNRRTDYIFGVDLSGSFQGAGGIGGILESVTTDANGNTSQQGFVYDFNGNVVNLALPRPTDLEIDLTLYVPEALANALPAFASCLGVPRVGNLDTAFRARHTGGFFRYDRSSRTVRYGLR